MQSPDTTIARFRRWFWRPPRLHGEIELDRHVSNLELLYDLVYAALIAQASHRLAADVSPGRILEFAIVFGVIVVAWMNGSLYLELHGREDGRTRSFTFLQIGVLALLAMFTADAPGTSGRPFALVYTVFLGVVGWLWLSVRRRDSAEWQGSTGTYLSGIAASMLAMTISAFLEPGPRLVTWAAVAVGWVTMMELVGRADVGLSRAVAPTESLVERFGLFVIIVLGEVVFGVVQGLSEGTQDGITIVTGLIGLGVGFGLWWIYFDVVGGRFPRREGWAIATWSIAHFPLTLAIAASGAGMVSLIEHAGDAEAPAATVWLLSGAMALELLSVVVIIRTLADASRLPAVYRPLSVALLAGAVAALTVAWLQPAPWLLVVALGAILTALWFFTVLKFLRAGAWEPAATTSAAMAAAER